MDYTDEDYQNLGEQHSFTKDYGLGEVELVDGPPADSVFIDASGNWVYPTTPLQIGPRGVLGGVVDTFKSIWGGASSTAEGAADAYAWWQMHKRKIYIGTALVVGVAGGLLLWRIVAGSDSRR